MALSREDLQGKEPIWCAGCGDFGVLRAMQNAVVASGLRPHEAVLVTGIGCSGTITSSFRTYGFHGLHGRALPVATGIKLANPDLAVLVAGGDGDGYGIGLGHFLHAARRNVDLTYIVMDNQVYGLTKGQTSPTTDASMSTKASPLGPMADPVRPLEMAIAGGATFVAQGFSGDPKGLAKLVQDAMAHPGFALVNVQSPCVTYNMLNTYGWFRKHNRAVEHDPGDREAAMDVARADDHVPVGLLYRTERPVFADALRQASAMDPVESAAEPARALEAEKDRFAAWAEAFRVR